ncbi:MAG: molybdopterin-dependent oxidoreductase [Chloroflexi bacterium]|nr:molybdopterin-dependent oxidoreductase [Chloroflexota bacterium]
MSAGRAGFLAGVLAGVAMIGATLALRLATQAVSLPEVLAEWAITLLPAEVFSTLLDRLKFSAKPMLFASLLLGEVVVGGLLGWAWARRGARGRTAALLVGTVWLITVWIVLPLAGAGLLGVESPDGALATSGSILASYALYGAVLVFVYRQLVRPRWANAGQGEPPGQVARRLLLRRLGLGLAALAVGGLGWRALAAPRAAGPAGAVRPRATDSAQPTSAAEGAPFELPGLSPEVTPTEAFYRVSKNFFMDPTVDSSAWRLEINGRVERRLALSYGELKEAPSVQNFYTLECISNEVGGDLMGNAHWRGVRLRDLLAQAGVAPGVVDVVIHAGDGYADSIPLALGLHPDTILAYEMNGQPLAQEHGFPARLLVPGIYGMKNVKWVTRVELVDYDFRGFWQQEGWSDVATYLTMARLDLPQDGSHLALGPQRLAGVAFAGDRGIARVEVSLDDGATWAEADLKPALSPYTWRLWSFAWTPTQPGSYHLLARATDGQGNLQTDLERPPLPNGATGYHRITVRVG